MPYSTMLSLFLTTTGPVASPPPAAAPSPVAVDAAAPAAITVRVDDRVTLLSIVARLSGADEYRDPRIKSVFADAVDAHFEPFREHDAVRRFRALRKERGVGYDAPMSLACHIGPLPGLEERVDFATAPERLDARWKVDETRAFLGALRAFVRDAGVEEFLATQRAFEQGAAARLAGAFDPARLRGWCEGYFGTREGARFEVRVGLLCGPHNYGVGARFPAGAATTTATEEITPVIGCWQWDDTQGLPTWPKGAIEPLIAHELCHSYVNAQVDRAWGALAEPSAALLALDEARMRNQAYSTARIVCYETIVRACVIRFVHDRAGAKDGGRSEERMKAGEVAKGFLWVPAVADALAGYEAQDAGTRDFGGYLETLAPVLAREARRLGK